MEKVRYIKKKFLWILFFLTVILIVLFLSFFHYQGGVLLKDNHSPFDLSYQNVNKYTFSEKIEAPIVLIGNLKTNQIIYSKNATLHTFPASIGKLIAALVVLDKMDLEGVITIDESMLNKNWGTIHFEKGEKVKVRDLLNMTLIMSANDSSMILASYYGREKFAALMNEKIKEIGMEDTVFFDPLCFDDKGNFTTALDLFKLSRYIYYNYPIIGEITRTKSASFKSLTGETHLIVTTNELLGQIDEIWGGKTGYTSGAGECLLLIYEFNVQGEKIPFVSIILNSTNRFEDTRKIYQWLKSNLNYVIN